MVGGADAATEARVDCLTYMTTCEGSEYRCCYHCQGFMDEGRELTACCF